MNPSDLDDCEESHGFLLERAAAGVRQGKGGDAPYVVVEIAQRILGICALLGRADTAGFVERLDRSGTARLRLLELAAGGHPCDPQVMVASRALGFVAALASGNLELSAAIARHLPNAQDPMWEYEDDFLFFDFLRHAAVGFAENTATWPAVADGTLRRWEAVVQGRDVAALETCRAILDKDGVAFDGAIKRFVGRRVEQLEKHRLSPAFNAKVFAAEGHVWIEGFAVLEIATRQGLPSEREYSLLPSMGRATRSTRRGPSPDWLLS